MVRLWSNTDVCRQLVSDDGEKTLEGFEGAFLAHPKQAGEPLVDLVDQSQIFVGLWRTGFHPRQGRGSTAG